MTTTLAVCFTNFGPYHLARLRALGRRLNESGGRLIGYEVASTERLYPWRTSRSEEPFEWITLFPDRVLEPIPRAECRGAIREALDRVWLKEAVKRRRVRRFSAGLVGGPRHCDYLVDLGMPRDRIAFGYNAVDNVLYATRAEAARCSPEARHGLPEVPYFLAVSRFAPEKNLPRLVRAFARYRKAAPEGQGWDLVLCGGGPGADEVEAAIAASGVGQAIHRPGFLQADELSRWYAFASAFVHPSVMEPWGLVVNEAAACGLPLLVSERAGCVETLVPDPSGTTGKRFDPRDIEAMAANLSAMADLPEADRIAMGRRAAAVVAEWGPERFARGTLEALALANNSSPLRRDRTLVGLPH